MRDRKFFVLLLLTVMFSLLGSPLSHAEPDFVRFYERGKLRLNQRLFFDAVKDLTVATNTEQGKTHFAAHYHLANAYYWLPDIQKAMQILEKAEAFIKNDRQKEARLSLVNKIKGFYGSMKITPEVDPEEVGKLKIKIEPKIPFSNAHKRRYFGILVKRIQTEGGLMLNNKPLYLPKGDYAISIEKNQCLKYGLFEKDQAVQTLSVGDGTAEVSLKEKPGCACTGGQELYKEKGRMYCACKVGSAWDEKAQLCKLIRANNTPWIIGGTVGGLLVVGGVVAIVIVVANSNAANDATAQGGVIKLF